MFVLARVPTLRYPKLSKYFESLSTGPQEGACVWFDMSKTRDVLKTGRNCVDSLFQLTVCTERCVTVSLTTSAPEYCTQLTRIALTLTLKDA